MENVFGSDNDNLPSKIQCIKLYAAFPKIAIIYLAFFVHSSKILAEFTIFFTVRSKCHWHELILKQIYLFLCYKKLCCSNLNCQSPQSLVIKSLYNVQ